MKLTWAHLLILGIVALSLFSAGCVGNAGLNYLIGFKNIDGFLDEVGLKTPLEGLLVRVAGFQNMGSF
jgi:hypothetical protein